MFWALSSVSFHEVDTFLANLQITREGGGGGFELKNLSYDSQVLYMLSFLATPTVDNGVIDEGGEQKADEDERIGSEKCRIEGRERAWRLLF